MSYRLYHGDCLDVLPLLPDSSVDAIIADWPYGTTACKWDSIIPLEPLWAECKRVIKRNGAIVLFGSQPFTSMLVMSNLDWFKYEWVWRKSKKPGYSNCKNAPMKGHEAILIFSAGTFGNGSVNRMTYNPQGLRSIHKPMKKDGTDNKNHRPGRKIKLYEYIQTQTGYPDSVLDIASENGYLHPTQKPLALLEYLVKTYTNPGDTVLDNTFGSCTTGEACLRTGRRFIGIEKDDSYFRIGQERLERVTMELKSMLPLFQEAVL